MTTDYLYNDQGQRVSQVTNNLTVDPETVLYLVDNNNPTGYAQVLEDRFSDTESTPWQRNSFVLGHDVISQARYSGVAGPIISSLMYDGHGSTRAVLDALAAVAYKSSYQQLFAYDAYGNLLDLPGFASAVGQAITTLLYSGEQTDGNGLQYLRARYYDPASGRFNRLDPFAGNFSDPQSLHKYLYVHGDPVNLLDPSGLVREGHHWIPKQVIGFFRKLKLITKTQVYTFLGRSSGPLSDTHYFDDLHRAYNAIVLEQVQLWVDSGKVIPIERMIDNIRAGKSFDGTRIIPVLEELNVRIIGGDALDPRYDFVSRTEVLRRGKLQASLKPTKFLLLVGALGVASQFGNAAAQANDLASILTEGEGIQNAISAATRGKEIDLRNALIGVGNADPSTFEELLQINPIFAIAFRKTVEVELALEGIQ